MNREQVFSLIRAHLADELEVDPDEISESTRFREDLEADSLDLYTLVQELEDSYGVKISDEQAAKILTVGEAVEFVLASSRMTRSRPEMARLDAERAAGSSDGRPSAAASQGSDSE
jgi:acyl carrier protein